MQILVSKQESEQLSGRMEELLSQVATMTTQLANQDRGTTNSSGGIAEGHSEQGIVLTYYSTFLYKYLNFITIQILDTQHYKRLSGNY